MGGNDLYEFGPFRLEPAERRLSRDGTPVALTPKCFDLLVVLLENSGHLLSKEELLKRLWPGQFVEESNLSFHISELRKTLSDGRDGVAYIETVRKKGFRFVGRVERREGGQSAFAALDILPPSASDNDETRRDGAGSGEAETARVPAVAVILGRRSPNRKLIAGVLTAGALAASGYVLWTNRAATSAGHHPRSLAVLPFKPLVSEASNQTLELGMADTLIAKLAAARVVTVRPLSAVRRYAALEQDAMAAGRELGVEGVLEGNIQRADGRIRVTARLMRVADGGQLWAGKFDEDFTDIFTVQDSISEQVVRSLALQLTHEAERRLVTRDTTSAEAYELYLKGRFFLSKRMGTELEKAIDHFRQAVAIDPRYALAHSGLAEASSLLSSLGGVPPRESFPQARAAAEHALSLDDRLAEAHTSLAFVKEAFEWDFQTAATGYRRAISLDPDYATGHHRYGLFLSILGRFDEGLAELERARHLDPTALVINSDLGLAHYFARRYERCIEQLQKTVELHPNAWRPRSNLSACYTKAGMFDEAIAEARKTLELMAGGGRGARVFLGFSYAAAGRIPEARAELREMATHPRRFGQPFAAAAAYAALGDKEVALELLEIGYEQRAYMPRIAVDPALDSLRSEPRFQELMTRVGLRQH